MEITEENKENNHPNTCRTFVETSNKGLNGNLHASPIEQSSEGRLEPGRCCANSLHGEHNLTPYGNRNEPSSQATSEKTSETFTESEKSYETISESRANNTCIQTPRGEHIESSSESHNGNNKFSVAFRQESKVKHEEILHTPQHPDVCPADEFMGVWYRVKTVSGSCIIVEWCEGTARRSSFTLRVSEVDNEQTRAFYIKPPVTQQIVRIEGLKPGEIYRIQFRNRELWPKGTYTAAVYCCTAVEAASRGDDPWCFALRIKYNDSSDEDNGTEDISKNNKATLTTE